MELRERNAGMIEVIPARTEAEIAAVRFLLLAYADVLRAHPGSEGVRADAERLPGPYTPPSGRLYLARKNGVPVGCAGLQRWDDRIGEVKRMFVTDDARRTGVARAILNRLMGDARAIGYDTLRLGTLSEMAEARALYRQMGFVEIACYRVDEKVDTVFFECHLT